MGEIFHGFELLLFKRFQSHPEQWREWRGKLMEKVGEKGLLIDDLDDIGDIPQSLWYLSVSLHTRQKYILSLVKDEIEREKQKQFPRQNETLLSRYLSRHQFTEFHLDSMFKYGEDNRLPREIFKCENVRYLSLKYNTLDSIPPDIGRLTKLQYLALTNNKLQVQSIPFTLCFCKNLKTLLLDNNLLDALPGFLLQISSIDTVHRHGNHNYFKATFMWYHTDVNYRIIPISGATDHSVLNKYESLQFWAAKAIISSKKDFFNDPSIALVLKDYISDIYNLFNICHNCNTSSLSYKSGYKIITFKNPYLGNTCVPFQHWACSADCARALEVPARIEQIQASKELDRKYDDYIEDCQTRFHNCRRSVLSCSSTPTSSIESEIGSVIEERNSKCTCSIL
ncbi:hypothetical protein LOTGIDRAFT_232454 [Lottia gigantea]|uniref:LRRCT domain-containing protein n=1 Tax=Lottia gigantea TaxID=225164 RepID=V4BYH7_LOTGI|nr:hypothetical protein LOTGIDRAFT_232454 [Lottia gigantea]ESO94194.1 hypothetical protein LOTGIDRAFT_232454 [Lottia gigantea]